MDTEARAGGRPERHIARASCWHVFFKFPSRRGSSDATTSAKADVTHRSGSRAIGSDRGQIAGCRGRAIHDAAV